MLRRPRDVKPFWCLPEHTPPSRRRKQNGPLSREEKRPVFGKSTTEVPTTCRNTRPRIESGHGSPDTRGNCDHCTAPSTCCRHKNGCYHNNAGRHSGLYHHSIACRRSNACDHGSDFHGMYDCDSVYGRDRSDRCKPSRRNNGHGAPLPPFVPCRPMPDQ